MQTIAEFLRSRGVRVLIVCFTPPALVKQFLAERPLPFPIVSDPQRDAYRIFELGRTSLLAFLRPRVLWGFLRYFLRGTRPKIPVDKDVLQLAGDFLLDASGRLVWSYASKHPADRPTPNDIRGAVERLA